MMGVKKVASAVGRTNRTNRFSSAFKGAMSGPKTGDRKVVKDRKHFDSDNETGREEDDNR